MGIVRLNIEIVDIIRVSYSIRKEKWLFLKKFLRIRIVYGLYKRF